jgi:site-specific DNA-methyltransferase (adenine-specific)
MNIYNIDCREFLMSTQERFDLCITSPPYNLKLRISKDKYLFRQAKEDRTTKYPKFTDAYTIDDFYNFHRDVLSLLIDKVDLIFYNIMIVTGSKRAFFKMIGEFSDYLKEIIIWDKGRAQPAMRDKVLNRQSELLLIFEKSNAISRRFKNCNFSRGTLSDIWKIYPAHSTQKNHRGSFPLALSNHILENFSIPGMRVIDPFMGTGTTGISAIRHNSDFTGCEIDRDTFLHAKERLSHDVQTSLLNQL